MSKIIRVMTAFLSIVFSFFKKCKGTDASVPLHPKQTKNYNTTKLCAWQTRAQKLCCAIKKPQIRLFNSFKNI